MKASLRKLERLGKKWVKRGEKKPAKTKGTMLAILYANAVSRATISKYEALVKQDKAKWKEYYDRMRTAEKELELLQAYLVSIGDRPEHELEAKPRNEGANAVR